MGEKRFYHNESHIGSFTNCKDELKSSNFYPVTNVFAFSDADAALAP